MIYQYTMPNVSLFFFKQLKLNVSLSCYHHNLADMLQRQHLLSSASHYTSVMCNAEMELY